jgi:uncharacterized membrane protein
MREPMKGEKELARKEIESLTYWENCNKNGQGSGNLIVKKGDGSNYQTHLADATMAHKVFGYRR